MVQGHISRELKSFSITCEIYKLTVFNNTYSLIEQYQSCHIVQLHCDCCQSFSCISWDKQVFMSLTLTILASHLSAIFGIMPKQNKIKILNQVEYSCFCVVAFMEIFVWTNRRVAPLLLAIIQLSTQHKIQSISPMDLICMNI